MQKTHQRFQALLPAMMSGHVSLSGDTDVPPKMNVVKQPNHATDPLFRFDCLKQVDAVFDAQTHQRIRRRDDGLRHRQCFQNFILHASGNVKWDNGDGSL